MVLNPHINTMKVRSGPRLTAQIAPMLGNDGDLHGGSVQVMHMSIHDPGTVNGFERWYGLK
jgi:hypothetical protein